MLGGALAICVFDAQDELAAVAPRVEPGKQGGANAAYMQDAGGTRRKIGF